MKAPVRILIVLIIFSIVAVIAGAYIMTEYIQHTSMIYPYGLSDRDKADALRIALSDPDIHDGIVGHGGQYTAGIAADGETGDSGFINISGKFMLVDISTGQGPPMPMWFRVLADVSNGREMEARYFYDVMPAPTRVLIPAGTSWYRLIKKPDGSDVVSISITLDQNNSTVYPIVMNSTSFERYRSGQPASALEYMDSSTGLPTRYDGDIPIVSGWSTNVTFSGENKDDNVYVVLKNNGSGDIVARCSIYPPGS